MKNKILELSKKEAAKIAPGIIKEMESDLLNSYGWWDVGRTIFDFTYYMEDNNLVKLEDGYIDLTDFIYENKLREKMFDIFIEPVIRNYKYNKIEKDYNFEILRVFNIDLN